MPDNSTLDDFLKDIPKDGDIKPDVLDEELNPKPQAEEKSEPPEKDEEPRKNRQHRRWESRLEDRERELIAREARAQALEELQRQDAPKDVPAEWLTIYGDTPATRQAWALQEKLIEQKAIEIREDLKREQQQEEESRMRAEREAEAELDDIFDSIEEKYDIDITSNSPAARKARGLYIDALSAISPKNKDGKVSEYGDPDAAFELYQLKRTQEKPSNADRNKELASRSISRSSSSEQPQQKSEDDATRAWLRNQGINV